MDITEKIVGGHRSSSDDECSYSSQRATVVSSTVSEGFTGLNIESEKSVETIGRVSSVCSFDDDVLSVCATEDDTKFIDDLIGENNLQVPARSGKRRREVGDSSESNPVPKPKRNRSDRRESHSQPLKRKSTEMMINTRRIRSMPLPNEMVQLSEISSSSKNEIDGAKQTNEPCKMSDSFESPECKKMAEVFGDPCLKFLNDACEQKECIHGHDLPNTNALRKCLNEMTIDKVRGALNLLVCAFDCLLERYFCTFAEFFAARGLKADLIGMLAICKSQTGHMQSNCAHVLDGLLLLGMGYSNALALIIDSHTELTEKSMFVLTALITDKRNNNVTRFLSDLMSFYDKKFRFNSVIIDRLMRICLELPYNEKWFGFVRKVVNEFSSKESIDDLDSDLLYDFCSMTPRRSEIIRKARSNQP